jgi:hypothetical protein
LISGKFEMTCWLSFVYWKSIICQKTNCISDLKFRMSLISWRFEHADCDLFIKISSPVKNWTP